jgi:hypothetical protein
VCASSNTVYPGMALKRYDGIKICILPNPNNLYHWKYSQEQILIYNDGLGTVG